MDEVTEGEQLRAICKICIYKKNFEHVQGVFDNMDFEGATVSVLLAPLAYTCTYRELFPGWQDYSRKVRAELERRGRADVDELMWNLE